MSLVGRIPTRSRRSITDFCAPLETCGASGLAIQAPGISRACGVCGSRNLKPGELRKFVEDKDASILHKVPMDVCGRCGGKFID